MTKRQGNTLYYMVKEKLQKEIQMGRYQVGDKIPTESELCEHFQVSRMTIRLALNELETNGILERIPGKGTFIKRQEIEFSMNRTFAEDISVFGKKPINKLIESAVIPAETPLNEFLQIPVKSPVTKLKRVRYADTEAILFETSHIPWSLAPGLANDDFEGSLFSHLKTKYNLSIHRSVDKLKPVLADHHASKLLNIKEGTPCFEIRTITYLSDNTPMEYCYGIHRGDFSNIVIERFF